MKLPQPSPLEFRLLALVIRERGGREIAKLYEKTHGVPISYGSLYTTLRRMADDGWIKVRPDPSGDGRARLFSIAAPGRTAFNAMATSFGRTIGSLKGAS